MDSQCLGKNLAMNHHLAIVMRAIWKFSQRKYAKFSSIMHKATMILSDSRKL